MAAPAEARSAVIWYDYGVSSTKEQNAAYYAANRDRYRNQRYLKAYGITIEQYDALFFLQDGLCAICHRPESRVQQGRAKRLHIDHDHRSGRVRGLLCAACNNGIGLLQDDPAVVASALDYLNG